MIDDVLGIPDQLRDALWRVDSARLEPAESGGLMICGMGGSAIGADLAAAAFGERLQKPLLTVRGYTLPSWANGEWTVLCSSYSGATEETLSCWEQAGALGARRLVVSTGGPLVDQARELEVPVVGLPGIFLPRTAVAYLFVVSAEVAALAGVGASLRGEIEAAADFLAAETESLKFRAAEIAAVLDGAVPVVHGAELTAPVARRWKTEINENAKAPSFFTELPEADHNEICGWGPGSAGHGLAAVLLEDRDQHPRIRRRFDLTAAAIVEAGDTVVRVETAGETRTARLLWATMLGDLVSVELASRRGVDPVPVRALDELKAALSG